MIPCVFMLNVSIYSHARSGIMLGVPDSTSAPFCRWVCAFVSSPAGAEHVSGRLIMVNQVKLIITGAIAFGFR